MEVYVVGLVVDDICVVICKEEPISDDELLASSFSERKKEKTWFPSECVSEEWNQEKEKRAERQEKLKQGHFASPHYITLVVKYTLKALCFE